MTAEKHTLLLIKGVISEMPEAEREKINSAMVRIKAIIDESPEHGGMAVALIGAEMAAA